MTQVSELRWLVALEAAVCFSLPSWMRFVDPAWSASDPALYTLAVVVGATLATLVCHVVPAWCSCDLNWLWQRWWARWPMTVLALGYATGAACILVMHSMVAAHYSLPYDESSSQNAVLLRYCVIALSLLFPIAISFLPVRRQWPVILACLCIGVGAALFALYVQFPGRTMVMTQLGNGEAPLGRHFEVARGLLLAAAPFTVIALRLGRITPERRTVIWTGLFGVWIPMICSAVIVSFAKMWGARLYWVPSLPIGTNFAFTWLFPEESPESLMWLIGVLTLASCMAYAKWLQNAVCLFHGSWLRVTLVLVILSVAFFSPWWGGTFARYWETINDTWAWAVVVGCVSLPGIRLVRLRS